MRKMRCKDSYVKINFTQVFNLFLSRVLSFQDLGIEVGCVITYLNGDYYMYKNVFCIHLSPVSNPFIRCSVLYFIRITHYDTLIRHQSVKFIVAFVSSLYVKFLLEITSILINQVIVYLKLK